MREDEEKSKPAPLEGTLRLGSGQARVRHPSSTWRVHWQEQEEANKMCSLFLPSGHP